MDADHPVVQSFLSRLKDLKDRYKNLPYSEKARYALVRHEQLMLQWGFPIPPTS